MIDAGSVEFAPFCRAHQVRYANAARRIPHATATVDAVYSSHMIEQLVRDDAWAFLLECHRVLRPGGRLRLVVPDLHALAHQYLQRGNADDFLGQLQFEPQLPPGLLGKLRWLWFGGRGHQWMYDARSLGSLMEEAGASPRSRGWSPARRAFLTPPASTCVNGRSRASISRPAGPRWGCGEKMRKMPEKPCAIGIRAFSLG